MTPFELSKLPLSAIKSQIELLDQHAKEAQNYKRLLEKEVLNRYADIYQPMYATKDDPFGTVSFRAEGELEIVIDTPKNVAWNQAILEAKAAEMATYGEDPKDYIRSKLEISESAWRAMPQKWKDYFMDARTVKPGSVKVSFK